MTDLAVPGRRIRAIILPDGISTQELDVWFNDIIRIINDQVLIETGNGSPEGVVEGVFAARYFDSSTEIFYMKAIDGGTTGWKAINS